MNTGFHVRSHGRPTRAVKAEARELNERSCERHEMTPNSALKRPLLRRNVAVTYQTRETPRSQEARGVSIRCSRPTTRCLPSACYGASDCRVAILVVEYQQVGILR